MTELTESQIAEMEEANDYFEQMAHLSGLVIAGKEFGNEDAVEELRGMGRVEAEFPGPRPEAREYAEKYVSDLAELGIDCSLDYQHATEHGHRIDLVIG